MTIAALADFICRKMQKTDAISVQFCKDAIRGRWEIVWNSRLWRQAIVPVQTFTTPGSAYVTVPNLYSGIERIIAARYGPFTELKAASWESLLRDDPAFYERIGQPSGFIQAGRVGGLATIRLSETPSTQVSILLIGKATFPSCALDTDSPSDYLDGVDRTLIAFGEGDMRERQNQWQPATMKFAEATALLAEMVSLQDDQNGQSYELNPNPVVLNVTEW